MYRYFSIFVHYSNPMCAQLFSGHVPIRIHTGILYPQERKEKHNTHSINSTKNRKPFKIWFFNFTESKKLVWKKKAITIWFYFMNIIGSSLLNTFPTYLRFLTYATQKLRMRILTPDNTFVYEGKEKKKTGERKRKSGFDEMWKWREKRGNEECQKTSQKQTLSHVHYTFIERKRDRRCWCTKRHIYYYYYYELWLRAYMRNWLVWPKRRGRSMDYTKLRIPLKKNPFPFVLLNPNLNPHMYYVDVDVHVWAYKIQTHAGRGTDSVLYFIFCIAISVIWYFLLEKLDIPKTFSLRSQISRFTFSLFSPSILYFLYPVFSFFYSTQLHTYKLYRRSLIFLGIWDDVESEYWLDILYVPCCKSIWYYLVGRRDAGQLLFEFRILTCLCIFYKGLSYFPMVSLD